MLNFLPKNIRLKIINDNILPGDLCIKTMLYDKHESYDDKLPVGTLIIARKRTLFSENWKKVNVYIISDDKIKVNDIYHERLIGKNNKWEECLFSYTGFGTLRKWSKKVSYTNDKRLDIPQISKEELEKIINLQNKSLNRYLKLNKLTNTIKYATN